MTIRIGLDKINKIYKGLTNITEAYLDTIKIFPDGGGGGGIHIIDDGGVPAIQSDGGPAETADGRTIDIPAGTIFSPKDGTLTANKDIVGKNRSITAPGAAPSYPFQPSWPLGATSGRSYFVGIDSFSSGLTAVIRNRYVPPVYSGPGPTSGYVELDGFRNATNKNLLIAMRSSGTATALFGLKNITFTESMLIMTVDGQEIVKKTRQGTGVVGDSISMSFAGEVILLPGQSLTTRLQIDGTLARNSEYGSGDMTGGRVYPTACYVTERMNRVPLVYRGAGEYVWIDTANAYDPEGASILAFAELDEQGEVSRLITPDGSPEEYTASRDEWGIIHASLQ